MCGLYGVAGDLNSNDKGLIRTLAILSTLRGEDSAGLIAVPAYKGNDPEIMKCVGTSFDLFDTKAFDDLRTIGSRSIIGHTRKATVGTVSKATAHPFNYDHIWGVHNGTLHYDWRHLPGGEEKTDSMSLYASVAKVGIEETIAQTKGAYAMVWFDQKEDTLNFLRNKERTLFYGFTDDLKKIIWASEPWMIFVAVNQAGLKLFNQGKKEDPEYVVPFETDTHFRLKVSGTGKDPVVFEKETDLIGGTKEVEKPWRNQTYTPHQSWKPNKSNGGQVANPFGESQKTNGSGSTNSSTSPSQSGTQTSTKSSGSSQGQRSTLSLVPPSKSDSSRESTDTQKSTVTDVVLLDDPVEGDVVLNTVTNKMLTKEEFESTVDQTCQFCTLDITFEDVLRFQRNPTHCADEGIGRWLSHNTFLCTVCATYCH